MALAEAIVADDEEALVAARRGLETAMGPAAVGDASAVASNFERMVRIADSTGIPLDAPVNAMSADFQEDLGLDRFAAAAYTRRAGPGLRLLGRVLRPLMPTLVRLGGSGVTRQLEKLTR